MSGTFISHGMIFNLFKQESNTSSPIGIAKFIKKEQFLMCFLRRVISSKDLEGFLIASTML